jgi:folate-dependent phosphoribosylglycinamide formyltransferase PurN
MKTMMKEGLYFKKVILSGSETEDIAERIHELEQEFLPTVIDCWNRYSKFHF